MSNDYSNGKRLSLDGRREKPAPNTKHGWGTHGSKTREQGHLTRTYAQVVSGATHESEHPVQANLAVDAQKVATGRNVVRSEVENALPAYQEVKDWHRGHAGTGSGNKGYDTGFGANQKQRGRSEAALANYEKGNRKTAASFGMPNTPDSDNTSAGIYRHAQNEALREGSVSNAVQLQQLGMAFSRKHQSEHNNAPNTTAVKQANDSYDAMLRGMGGAGQLRMGNTNYNLSQDSMAELLLARKTAVTGEWPSHQDFDDARHMANTRTFQNAWQTVGKNHKRGRKR